MTRNGISLRKLVAESDKFVVMAEYVPLPGNRLSNFEQFLQGYAAKKTQLPEDVVLAGLTIPQSPSGVATMSPVDIYAVLDKQGLWGELDLLAHVTAKDHNVDAIKSLLIGMAKLGIESVLVLTGDKPSESKGVFEVDAIGLIDLIDELNIKAFDRAKAGAFDKVHQFYIMAGVSPFKYTEASQMQQYYKMAKKVRVGAESLITQLGWDWRKSEELFRYMREEGITTPVFGNVYTLTTLTPAARLMYEGKLQGCVVTKEFFDKLNGEKLDDQLERTAQQMAMYRDMGAAGVDIGGLFDFDMLVGIVQRAGEIGADWREYADNLAFGPEGGFYLYDQQGQRREPSKPNAKINKKMFDAFHKVLFEPGQGLHGPAKAVLGLSKGLREGKGAMHKFFHACCEKPMKTLLFECEECGDCFLYENFSLCSMGRCEKGLDNAPCGDSNPDGTCGNNAEIRCVGEMIYDAAASEGPEGLTTLAERINPARNPQLAGTSSILNYFFGRDHTKKVNLLQIGDNIHSYIPKVGAAMRELAAKGAGAYDEPSGALNFIISMIRGQDRHRADYIAVNVDALAGGDGQGTAELMRQYVRLVEVHSHGAAVGVDSKDCAVLAAGLREWYGGREKAEKVKKPLLRSAQLPIMDEVLGLNGECQFKMAALLADEAAGSNGDLTAERLCELARKLFQTATERYNFGPDDVLLEVPIQPLMQDKPQCKDMPSRTYVTFEAIRRIMHDAGMKGVHTMLSVADSAKGLPGRKIGVCRAYVAQAQARGLDAISANVTHDYGLVESAADLMELVDSFGRQDGSSQQDELAAANMEAFCRANQKAKK